MIDYCGSTGTEWVPDVFPQSCQLHDICYAQKLYTQEYCDTQFFYHMIEERGLLLLPIAIIFFIGVRLYGKKAWLRAQKKSVE